MQWTKGRSGKTATAAPSDLPASSAASERPSLEFRSLPQTRLDTICNPSPTTHRTLFRWLCRLGGNPETYTLPMMVAKRAEITAEIAALEPLVLDPSPDLPAAAWTAQSEALCRLRGMALALDETMKRAAVAPRSSTGSAPRSAQEPVAITLPPLPEAESTDPFEAE